MREVPCPALARTVRLPEHPERIVSLSPSLTDAVVELGMGDRLVGRSAWCWRPPSVRDLPVVGSYTGCRRDRLRALDPDLVLVAGGVQDSLARELSEEGWPVYQFFLPSSPWGIVDTASVLGILCGVPDSGLDLARRCHGALDELAGTVPPLSTWVEIDLGGPVTTGLGSYVTWCLRWMGLRPLGWEHLPAYREVGRGEPGGPAPELVVYDPQPRSRVSEVEVRRRLAERGLGHWTGAGTRIVVTEGDVLAHHGPWLLLEGLPGLRDQLL